jgi:hypothetical protein
MLQHLRNVFFFFAYVIVCVCVCVCVHFGTQIDVPVAGKHISSWFNHW